MVLDVRGWCAFPGRRAIVSQRMLQFLSCMQTYTFEMEEKEVEFYLYVRLRSMHVILFLGSLRCCGLMIGFMGLRFTSARTLWIFGPCPEQYHASVATSHILFYGEVVGDQRG